jgi:hypothetical protein
MFIPRPALRRYLRRMRWWSMLALLLPLGTVAAMARPPGTPSPREMRSLSWQEQISEADRKRLAGLWNAWTRALNQAETAGETPRLTALGPLAVADAARPATPPGPGDYLCRNVRIGHRDPERSAAVPTVDLGQPQPCTIKTKKGLLWLEQAAGPDRIGGTLYADADRMVFLGSKALGDELGMRVYGSDATRDQVGVVRAIGDNHWRLELPWPHWQSNLELVEIMPIASPQPGGGG